MSARLDKSLDEIISTQRRSSGRGRGRRVHRTAPAATAPAGGVKKNPKHAKGAVKNIPTGPSGSSGEGKILVTGFPKDITEPMIKEYFVKMIGPVKRVELSYGPGGASRGIANILFARSESATRAVAECNGIPVDGKPIKVELIIDATRAKAIPPPKGLSERITSQPKPQPKSAAVTKTAGATRGRGKGGRGKGAARNARPAKKTAEELDSEMVDYWQAGAAATETNGAAQPAAGGDANMDDEIL
ncbi:putative mRNA export protein mlo3 [Hyaloscypha sp. PMI_1271]|nr:putative mRNA export protein mlo3 [Hyaloscypha sp. PMI_1271]